jgi:hypothetical protein
MVTWKSNHLSGNGILFSGLLRKGPVAYEIQADTENGITTVYGHIIAEQTVLTFLNPPNASLQLEDGPRVKMQIIDTPTRHRVNFEIVDRESKAICESYRTPKT